MTQHNQLPAKEREERRDRIIELSRMGMSAREIGEKLGVNKRTVFTARRLRGISQGAPVTPMTSEEIARAEAMLADGCSSYEIARTLGRAQCTIFRRFKGRWQVSFSEGARIRLMNKALDELDWERVRLREAG